MKVKFGIVGPGHIAHKFVQAVNEIETAEVVGVASSNMDRAKAFATQHQISNVFPSYDALLSSPLIDAVYIATTNQSHKELIEKALKNHKAVLCEKPLTLNEQDTKDMVALAESQNTLLMEGMWTRFLPATNKAIAWVKEGKIGHVKQIKDSFCFRAYEDPSSRLFSKALGGGALLDIGVYCLYYPLFFDVGALKELKGTYVNASTGVDAQYNVSLKFENNVLFQSVFSILHNDENKATICGDAGKIVVHDFYGSKKAQLFDDEGNVIEEYVDEKENGFVYEVAHFVEVYQNGKIQSPLITHEWMLKVAQITEQLK